VLGLRPGGLRGLRAEPVILSFLADASGHGFCSDVVRGGKSRALRLDAFHKEEAPWSGATYQGSVSRRLGI
jgi:hypothetical protein